MNRTLFDMAIEHLFKAQACLILVTQDDAYFTTKSDRLSDIIASLKKYEIENKIRG